jgi:hypothetical protein
MPAPPERRGGHHQTEERSTLNPASTRTVADMSEILISDLARESGFPSSTLRYYERVGTVDG